MSAFLITSYTKPADSKALYILVRTEISMAKTYAENLSMLRKLGVSLRDANSFAKIKTDAEKLAERRKLLEEFNRDLKECGLGKHTIEGDEFEIVVEGK